MLSAPILTRAGTTNRMLFDNGHRPLVRQSRSKDFQISVGHQLSQWPTGLERLRSTLRRQPIPQPDSDGNFKGGAVPFFDDHRAPQTPLPHSAHLQLLAGEAPLS